MIFKSLLKNSKDQIYNNISTGELEEITQEEGDRITAVGSSLESKKWLVNEGMEYLINKRKL